MKDKVTVIVLAGQRAGVVNPLAERAGVSHKCFVDIAGRPLVAHVLDTLSRSEGVEEVRISLEDDAFDTAEAIAAPFRQAGLAISFHRAKSNLVESVETALGKKTERAIITTADNVLLTQDGLDRVHRALADADVVFALARKESIHAVHPQGQRNFYKFADGEFSNCNIYGLGSRQAFAALDVFREGGQFMKNKGRMVRAFGLFNILLMRAGLMSTATAARRIGKRFGVTASRIIFEDGALAIDVDNERTYAIAEQVLKDRARPAGQA